jgi:uncharacterized protein YecT (DUF1311 family)
MLCARLMLMAVGLGTLPFWAAPARAQQPDEPDPCADAPGRLETSKCWTREAERADQEMREAYDALLLKLPRRAAGALKKAQKLWLDDREAHLLLLYAIANPANVHDWDDATCAAIARRELALQRTRVLKRLGERRPDEACPL